MPNAVEAGIKDLRVNFIRETVVGAVQANPAWLRFSDNPLEATFSPNGNVFEQMKIGSPDIQDFLVGPEDHEATMKYHLQRWLSGGTPDAARDGLLRAADGAFLNTHAIQARQDLLTGGTESSGVRVYTIAKGGRVARVAINGQPDTGEPAVMELGYVFEKIRSYRISQPASSTQVTVESSSAADTTQSCTIENEGASTSVTLSLTGTTPVASVSSFTDIDSISLSAEMVGDLIVKIQGGNEICRILGSASQGAIEGDLGIPPLGSGSFESALGTTYETILGSTITRGGSDFDAGLNPTIRQFGVTVENNLEITPRITTRKRRIIEGTRRIESAITLFSETGSHDAIVENLKATESDIVWTLSGGTITVVNAALTTPASRTYQNGQATMTRNNVFTGRSLTIA